jgi:type IV pilus assembly protein PilE
MKLRGLTLLELVITLAVIALLTALAVPVYTDYLTRSRRVDAYSALVNASAELAHYYGEHQSYKEAALTTVQSAAGFYHLQLTSTDTTYKLIAIAQKSQASRDTLCQSFTLTHHGERGITGPGDIQACWQ